MKTKAINPKYNVALMASAGTGKTYNLALRAVAILMRDRTIDQPLYDIKGVEAGSQKTFNFGKILCITFTKKATAEMASRVNEYLTKLANGQLGEESNEYKAIADVLKITGPNEMRKRASAVLSTLFRNPDILQVRTIDSFVNMILRLFPFEANVRPDFDILDSDATRSVKYEAFETAFQLFFSRDEYHELFNRYIIWADIIPKTFINNLKDNIIDFVLERSISIEEQLQEMEHISVADISMVMDDAERNSDVIVEIFGGLLEMVLYEGEYKGFTKGFIRALPLFKEVLAGRASIEACMKMLVMFDIKPDNDQRALKSKTPMPQEYYILYKDFTSLLKRHVEYAEKLDLMILLHVALKVQHVVDTMKMDQGVLSFSDVTYAAYRMLRQAEYGITNDYLYFRLDGRLEHILIDEFQDTSDVQWKLIQPLVDEAMAGQGQYGKSGSFFCVGDPKQTIYRFRGSDPNFFHNVIQQYKGRLTEETLYKNYRSDQAIVSFTNKLFSGVNEILGGGEDVSFQFAEQTAESKRNGFVSLATATGGTVAEVGVKRLEYLEKQLHEVITIGGWRLSDIAILVAKRETGFQVMDFLDTLGIKSYVTFNEKLSQGNVFKAINALVTYMALGNDFALAEFIFAAPAMISDLSLTDDSPFQAIKAQLTKMFAKTKGQPVYQRIMSLDGILSLTRRFGGDNNYYLLLDLIGTNLAHVVNPLDFKAQLARLAANSNTSSSRGVDGIAIMTVHGAKGLEFPVVIAHDIRKNFQIHNTTKYFINEGPDSPPRLYKKHHKSHWAYSSEIYKRGEALEAKLTKYGSINELYVAVTRAQRALYYTAGLTDKKSEAGDTDRYVLNKFKEGCVTGSLPLSENPYINHAQSKRKTDRFADFCADIISSPIKYTSEPDTAREILAQNLNNNAYNGELKDRAVKYLENALVAYSDEGALVYEPYLNRYFGTFVHEVIYSMSSFTADSLDAAVDKAWNRYGGYLGANTKDLKNKAVKAVLGLINNDQWTDIIHGGIIYREKTVSNNSKPLVIDFYIVKPDQILVADFKTGEQKGRRHQEYAEQVSGYVYVLKKHYRKPVKGYLIYVNENSTEIEEIM